jgi:hypothetical protein
MEEQAVCQNPIRVAPMIGGLNVNCRSMKNYLEVYVTIAKKRWMNTLLLLPKEVCTGDALNVTGPV